ncbi:FAD-dependent oxidoreductase [Actinomycetospora termitidis]|uniref:D-amino-acid oxidase n=1 Tax=Actinomycetospora termitidis TaxID=3053470 RepID=A0ABT7MDE1_9PSEU|nr:FAD-dependent oxidoreductase [Actinomycetospora sp. Odt1-22]MDL5158673.1 FAD-dependent oxidoreductase [Actinomycetospora sp. Odt1-22]
MPLGPDPSTPRPDAVVVGAGVVGLTAAVALAGAGHRVEVWTADDPAGTPSARAAGVWTPKSQAPLATSVAWARQSLQDFCGLARVAGSGVRLVEGLTLTAEPDEVLPPLTRLSPDLRPAAADELPAAYRAGLRYRMPVVDMARYVPWLLQRLDAYGGRVRRRRVQDLAEPLAVAPVVVNAAGLGAGALAGDTTVRPVFSQYVVTDNPGLDRVLVDTSDPRSWVSIIPHRDRVHLGGVRVTGREDPRPDRELAADVLRHCREIEPRLVDARMLRVDTGLLPGRPTMRVQAEQHGDGTVVHAYGHATAGVTLSWGAAREVARLAGEPRRSSRVG